MIRVKLQTRLSAAKFVKFLLVGGTVFCIQAFLTWLFKRKLMLGNVLSLSFAYTISASIHFLLNNYFTFNTSHAKYRRRVIGYLLIIASNYFITTITGTIILQYIIDHILISTVTTTAITTLYSFYMLNNIVYKNQDLKKKEWS